MKLITSFIGRVVLLGLLLSGAVSVSYAQTPLNSEEKQTVVAAITSPWNEWESMSISGKFRMAGLPLSPSVKIYMKRDSSLFISLRAPLMGEVGRAEINSDTLLVVNKMKKTYVKEPLEKVLSYYPGTLSDLQDLLLGRVVIPGFGLLDAEHYDEVELYPEENDEFSLIPAQTAEIEGFNYGYLIDEYARPEVLLVMPANAEGVVVSLTYEYYDKGYDLTFSYQSPKKIYTGTLELDPPDAGGSAIEPIKLNSRYSQLTFPQFMKSF